MMQTIFSKDFKKARMGLFSVLVLFLFVGCGGAGVPPATKIAPQIFVVPSETEERWISDESWPINNCAENVEMSQAIERSHTITYALELGNGYAVNSEGKLQILGFGEISVGGAVASNYNVGYGNQESVGRSLTITAEENTHVQYTIRQYEIWETGKILVVMGGENQEIPYSFRRDFRLETLDPIVLSNCDEPLVPTPQMDVNNNVVPTSTVIPVAQENTPNPSPDIATDLCPPLGSPDAIFSEPLSAMGTPAESAGTGIFANAVRPQGTQPAEYSYVKDALDESCIQLISPIDSNSNRHCTTSQYNTNRIWIGTVQKGTALLVKSNDSEEYDLIGQIDKIAPDARSYLVEYTIDVGDEICLEAPPGITMGDVYQAGGYHLMIGRDLTVFTNSWCIMLENDGSQHWCQ